MTSFSLLLRHPKQSVIGYLLILYWMLILERLIVAGRPAYTIFWSINRFGLFPSMQKSLASWANYWDTSISGKKKREGLRNRPLESRGGGNKSCFFHKKNFVSQVQELYFAFAGPSYLCSAVPFVIIGSSHRFSDPHPHYSFLFPDFSIFFSFP